MLHRVTNRGKYLIEIETRGGAIIYLQPGDAFECDLAVVRGGSESVRYSVEPVEVSPPT